MKSFLQLFLLFILIVIGIFFYNSYFVEKNIVTETFDENNIDRKITQNKKNIITNLQYNVELKDSGKYEIKSKSSELIYENGFELVFMKDVVAIFTDKKNRKIFITSDFATFNSSNYNTYFKENIKINYQNHNISSGKIDFNFIENDILVYENVVYSGPKNKIHTDNIKINLITKNIDFYMDNSNENIKIITR
ncbi:LPS export ABC transporter periplasmic protein LptC [Candidatus Pelagibacter sp.]|uniref:LPS export ABC transporter periplasmic protein LptC n=1 Tax=Candidatus Pelagibacter sp. TaxID=2024849 RepID=UPI003F8310FE